MLPLAASQCQKKSDPAKATKPEQHTVVPLIQEASGIADSKSRPGNLWVIEDGGNPAQLIVLGHDGKVKEKIPIASATNRDWEDLVLAGNQLFIGEIGDNDAAHNNYTLYRFPEPEAGASTVPQVAAIRFRYADQAHDAEAFLVDPDSGDIFLITKRDSQSKIFRLAANYSLSQQNIAAEAGILPYNGVVSACLAPDGKSVIVKTYNKIYRYSRATGESIAAALKTSPTELPYEQEPQGEAICFRQDGKGYFTLSEKLIGNDVFLYYYQLK
ncbi:hypothetical protein SAMN05444008_102351 [Cnuella takakiae]|uniref:Uncharacterized protein n=2 Tax=Cnuella takakiae TaxID=1302690 RepID=A0A1M4VRF2_9BACT|nr:hypothetical protein BUE76_11965 [Cnuella takakiae]SHE71440.1 hypothetical protein SAMN05444008_102351 [Cnuella takakiae]